MHSKWHFDWRVLALGSLIIGCAKSDPIDAKPPGEETPSSGGAKSSGGGGSGGNDTTPPIFGGATGSGGAPAEDIDASEACARSSALAERVPAIIEVVLDTSGSMRWVAGEQREPGPGEQSKLDVTRDALARAVDAMPDTTSVGLFVYPGREDDVAGDCLAPNTTTGIAPLSPAQRTSVQTALSNLVAQGGTPTHDAYHLALSDLQAVTAEGDRYMVLITDGVPTYLLGCDGNGTDPVSLDPLGVEAARAATARVRTFVVGSPGSEPARASLSHIASLGGTAEAGCSDSGPTYCHFDMTTAADFAASLQAALDAIGGRTLSCSYEIPEPPNGEQLDPNRVNVRFTSASGAAEDILRDPSDSGCESGWQYTEDGTRIVLCQSTCDRVRSETDAKVEVLFGCETKVGPIR